MNEKIVTINGRERVVTIHDNQTVSIDGRTYNFELESTDPNRFFLRLNKKAYELTKVVKDKNKIVILTEGHYFECTVQTKLEKNAESILAHSEKSRHKEDIKSPMPGMVLKLLKKVDEEVTIGEPVLILEAMKMENEVTSPYSGVIKDIFVSVNTAVEKGSELFRIE